MTAHLDADKHITCTFTTENNPTGVEVVSYRNKSSDGTSMTVLVSDAARAVNDAAVPVYGLH